MEMHQVRYFVALAEELNFTKAASRCHVSQPALTRAVRLLEHELGGALLQRERRTTHLTELGNLMRPYFIEILQHADAAKKRAVDHKRSGRDRLRLGVMSTIAPQPMLALVQAVHSTYPEVDLEIVDASAEELEQLLLSGKLDVVIACRPARSVEGVHYHPIMSERMMIVLPPKHRLAGRDVIAIDDLGNERYLDRAQCDYAESLDWQRRQMPWNKVASCARDDWILSMVANGFGISLFPEHGICHSGVVAKPTADPQLTREVHIATVRGRRYSAPVGALVHEAMRKGWLT